MAVKAVVCLSQIAPDEGVVVERIGDGHHLAEAFAQGWQLFGLQRRGTSTLRPHGGIGDQRGLAAGAAHRGDVELLGERACRRAAASAFPAVPAACRPGRCRGVRGRRRRPRRCRPARRCARRSPVWAASDLPTFSATTGFFSSRARVGQPFAAPRCSSKPSICRPTAVTRGSSSAAMASSDRPVCAWLPAVMI